MRLWNSCFSFKVSTGRNGTGVHIRLQMYFISLVYLAATPSPTDISSMAVFNAEECRGTRPKASGVSP
jgi:hypothetical protein